MQRWGLRNCSLPQVTRRYTKPKCVVYPFISLDYIFQLERHRYKSIIHSAMCSRKFYAKQLYQPGINFQYVISIKHICKVLLTYPWVFFLSVWSKIIFIHIFPSMDQIVRVCDHGIIVTFTIFSLVVYI